MTPWLIRLHESGEGLIASPLSPPPPLGTLHLPSVSCLQATAPLIWNSGDGSGRFIKVDKWTQELGITADPSDYGNRRDHVCPLAKPPRGSRLILHACFKRRTYRRVGRGVCFQFLLLWSFWLRRRRARAQRLDGSTLDFICSCISMAPRMTQNLNIAPKNWIARRFLDSDLEVHRKSAMETLSHFNITTQCHMAVHFKWKCHAVWTEEAKLQSPKSHFWQQTTLKCRFNSRCLYLHTQLQRTRITAQAKLQIATGFC